MFLPTDADVRAGRVHPLELPSRELALTVHHGPHDDIDVTYGALGTHLARDRELPALERGERVAVLGAGAYGFVMASNYNTRPRPVEIMVDGGRWWVARPREGIEEMYRSDRMTP